MATLVLSAAGSALGGSFGGSFLGLAAGALGKAAGATLGAMIDQRLLGAGATPVEAGRVERLRVMGSSEGAVLPRCFGRMRVAGQLIWSSRFIEDVSRERVGGKATAPSQEVRRYSYSISIAVALCEGEVARVGRIWADGQPLDQSGLVWRLHTGSEDQLPDPLIAAIEGADNAPAYRGTAYVVFEDLDVTPFGNRIPQFNFEVFRPSPVRSHSLPRPAAEVIGGVALVPGTGEYSLATRPVTMVRGRGDAAIVNVNNDRGLPDFLVSMDQLNAELPQCRAISLIVSWFSDDLRVDRAQIYPAVEQGSVDGEEMPWSVSGTRRSDARVVSEVDGRPIFGGTPADQSVLAAIRHLRADGKAVMFYPFLLLDILKGNGLENPYDPAQEQPRVPWRGRMTLSRAPGVSGSPDRTGAAADEVRNFFGNAERSHFQISGERVIYSGPQEWSYRRFILHYAHLCALAGGVDSFCIGSEMRGLTQIRDGRATFPAVLELCRLAADVRQILGAQTRIGYAADWSEYFGYQPVDGSGDVLFHLDPLWAHPAIDFVGIDNYMPLSDWRDEAGHLDAGWRSIYDLDYLEGNVAGGEGFDWYYPDDQARLLQQRAPITDGAHGEPWTFRYKDIRAWWENRHFNRIDGVKVATPTAWVPRSKPIWFTEVGCPAVDKGTNQPNVFHDPKSSESFFPHFSSGVPDIFIQQRYLQATYRFWSKPENNPVSSLYGGPMVDLARTFVWAWDARPWPDFPRRLETWVDGTNYETGHWLNGRISLPSLAAVVAEICERAGMTEYDVSNLHGVVTGYIVGSLESARQSLQPLMLAFGIDVYPVSDRLVFVRRGMQVPVPLDLACLVDRRDAGRIETTRSSSLDLPGRISFGFLDGDNDYQAGAAEARAPEAAEPVTAELPVPLVMTFAEAEAVAERCLHEARAGNETVSFTLPPSRIALGVGDVIEVSSAGRRALLRLDRVDEKSERHVTATRIDEVTLATRRRAPYKLPHRAIAAASPVHLEFLDLPLLTGEEVPHAPHVAAFRRDWAGRVAVLTTSEGGEARLCAEVERPATLGRILDPFPEGVPGMWMNRTVRVKLDGGLLASREEADVLSGQNVAALRCDETGRTEVFQFARADLVGPRTYRLSRLLRGQLGTDADMPETWPEGTTFVLVDQALKQLDLPQASVGRPLQFLFGPADRPLTDASFRQTEYVPRGMGLRPLTPVHLRAERQGDGGIRLRWIRRTRIAGDSWIDEVPVGEESLLFEWRIVHDGRLIRSDRLPHETLVYTQQQQLADGVAGTFVFEVAQVSPIFGPGPFQRMIVDV
jgi:hypothetical protein